MTSVTSGVVSQWTAHVSNDMYTHDLVRLALHDIRINGSRSILTVLGIIIGVAAVVLMTGVGRSMEGVILGQINTLGPQTIALWPGKGPEGGAPSIGSDFKAVTQRDVDALKQLTSVTSVAPIIMTSESATFGKEKADASIVGSPPEYYDNVTLEVTSGRFHDLSDEQGVRTVAVIGSDIARDLFFNQDPIGQRIGIGERKFTVIGVLKSVGSQFFQNQDTRIIIPFATARVIEQRDYVDMVTMNATRTLDEGLSDVEYLLRKRHSIAAAPSDDPTKNDDFLVRSSAQAQDILGTVSLALTLFITMVASISLVVGGIGIMNIMLVSVTERTREIGLRKALGATERDILLQFLVEAVVVTVFGALIGLLIGVLFDVIIVLVASGFLAAYKFALNPIAISAALLMAVGVGLGFGIYPARKASMLEPIESLRYE